MMKKKYNHLLIIAAILGLAGCKAGKDNPGLEYAPNMYHSIAYESLTQITDESAGTWLSSDDDSYGEFFNSNPNNPHRMNLRLPPPNTVRRTKSGWFPYHIPRDSAALAGRILVNPLDSTAEVVEQGKQLFLVFCQHCHGEQGKGDGKVGVVFKGVPAYNAGQTKNLPAGHIFHVITYGIRRMGGHGSQIPPEDRWKIVRYVQVLQKQQ
jgi:mono/diheme cytochrome c family protein